MKVVQVSDQIIETELQKFKLLEADMSGSQLLVLLADLFEKLREQTPRTVVISLIGGAASGKTTLASNLVKTAESNGLTAGTFSTDDFLLGDRAYRREHFEGKEPLAKYDFAMMNRKIEQIKSNTNPEKIIGSCIDKSD